MKIFISGSCVTRDAFSLESTEFILEEYVARYSIARVPYQSVEDEKIDIALESPFQKKLVKNDILNKLTSLIKSQDFDFFIMDFIDERFGLIRYENTYVTASSEFMNSKLLCNEQPIRINFDSDVFFKSWEKGFVEVINAVEDKTKIIINKVFWSTKMAGGGEIKSSNINYINRGNSQLEKLYEIALKYIPKDQFIEYPRDIFSADENHKWGISPFHYVPAVYRRFIDELKVKTRMGYF